MSSPLWDGVREGCGSCEFGHRSSWNRLDTNGVNVVHVNVECRRYPPTMIQGIEKTTYDGTPQYDVSQVRPNMAESDWCGEYKRKVA